MARNWTNPDLRIITASTLDRDLLSEAICHSDIVFHLAGNSRVRVENGNTKLDYEQNLTSTYNVLEAMKNSVSCKRIIFASSSTVYGEPTQIPTPENYAPLMPISLYGASKLASEALISGYCHIYNMSGIAVRLANIVGTISAHGVVYDLISKIETNSRYLKILGDGKQKKSYLYIDDCIDALILLLSKEKKCGFEIYNTGSNDAITVSEIAKIVIKQQALENVDIIYQTKFGSKGWKGDVREMPLDCSKIGLLNWKAKYNSEKAVTLAAQGIIRRLHYNEKICTAYIS